MFYSLSVFASGSYFPPPPIFEDVTAKLDIKEIVCLEWNEDKTKCLKKESEEESEEGERGE